MSLEFDSLTKAELENVMSGAKFRYEILKNQMRKRGLSFQEWVDLTDLQREAWCEFFWELLDIED